MGPGCSLAVLLGLLCASVSATDQGKTIEGWAQKLGTELRDLGQAITKSLEINKRYSYLNAQIVTSDPKQLLAEIVGNITRMMSRKMNAIRCILKTAEDVSEAFEYEANETYTYYSSKYSEVENITIEIPPSLSSKYRMYIPMYLNNDTHFYNVPVNTTHSSVHVPVNVFDRHKEAKIAIQWSEALDEVFRNNYNSDPALSWQYFGSSTGVMRHYPAMHWKESEIDMFDCRIRTWFIEAATCTKDVLILYDTSGSMQGMRKHIASFTISSILDTFSNNDYINVLNYSISFNYTVPCFKDMLVQATRENINTFKLAVQAIEPDKKSNVTEALGEAFALLARYREERGCSGNSSHCNQAIMLVTDGIAGNLSEIFEDLNWMDNGTNIPVRLFTYLIGKEVTKVNEIMWAACVNRGYYAHVQSLEEVTGSVFKYIPVVARPLVLQGVEHPVSWTHAYADLTYDDANDKVFNEPYRLLTSVAVPAFDRKVNNQNDSRTADLLGVAATDVPIDDIAKLTLPYKIGVMSYAFVVTNNGYVLMHPSLRPVFNKTILKENYNSVDLAEVEQRHDRLDPRVINPSVLALREALVKGLEGDLPGARLKYHFDNMRRISVQSYHYYFAPLLNTPFSIGLAIPDTYGNFSIQVSDEIQRHKHTGIDITSFFNGTNWKIHPKWVYCKYHYLEGHEFESPESELLHFLRKMYQRDFKWNKQYEEPELYFDDRDDDIECGHKTLGDDDYYCDRDLLQRLIFDAKNTYPAFEKPWKFNNEREESLFMRYNATLRFAGTMSGLTRWEYIYGEEEDSNKTEFGDLHKKAIDETWYKSAVLQHQFNPESFVYSVPFESGGQEDILVTGSYAIFPNDGGIEAPGTVVGFQFSHQHMQNRFFEITSKVEPNATPCGDLLDCYVIDNSGYVVISHNELDTGRFFGEVECAVMESMVEKKMFEKIVIYDLQGLCPTDGNKTKSDASFLLTPLDIGRSIVNYILSNIFWTFMRSGLYQLWDPNWTFAAPPLVNKTKKDEEKKIRYYPCDLQRDLFLMDQHLILRGNLWNESIYFAKSIPFSNLVLVVVKPNKASCNTTYTTSPTDVLYPEGIEHPCQKLSLRTLPRRRLAGCFNEHPLEHEIKTCGRSSNLAISTILLLIMLILLKRFN